MNQALLGKILATIATAAIDAGAIETNPIGVLENPIALNAILGGFLSIWLTHPASGAPSLASTLPLQQVQRATPQMQAPLVPSGPK